MSEEFKFVDVEENLKIKLGERFGYMVYGSFHRARKERECKHCGKKIKKGDIYYKQSYGRFFYETFGSISPDAYCLECAFKYLPYKRIIICDRDGNTIVSFIREEGK